MTEERLLERIKSWKLEPNRREGSDKRRIISSVTLHLQRILNTWHGNVPIAEDYGIPDLQLMHCSEKGGSVYEIETAIRRTVSLYEPRLKDVRVLFVPGEDGDMQLIFRISADLVLSDSRTTVTLETIVDSEGKIIIRS